MGVKFVIEKIEDKPTGQTLDAVVKKEEGKPDDIWCTILDLDRLFSTCASRWGSNWNLDKVCVAIQESEIE